jgi:ornithine cyclodeaminase
MIVLNHDDVAALLPWAMLTDQFKRLLGNDTSVSPPRLQFELSGGAHDVGTLLVMPAWRNDAVIGLKTVTFWESNRARGHASHGASYIIINARSGVVEAILDGAMLTERRTAALSAAAASCLMRKDATRMLVVGTGPVARALAQAHAACHGFEAIEIFGRQEKVASEMAAELRDSGWPASQCGNLEQAVRRADLIVTATSATAPIVHGRWLKAGVHLSLIGSFKPTMREADGEAFRRAGQVWLDDRAALAESGDLLDAFAEGCLDESRIDGDLRLLLRSSRRSAPDDITIFKCAGFAAADLIAAEFALARASSGAAGASPRALAL